MEDAPRTVGTGDPWVAHEAPLRDLALLFLKLGTIGFGGPAAHIAMMEEEVVVRRRWLTREQFLDYVGATNLIPGPNSTELAIHIGHARAGWPGLIVAGVAFIVPATLIVAAIAWLYLRTQSLPAAAAVLYGVKPVVIAVVVQALIRLARSACRTTTLTLVGVAAVVAILLGAHELIVLLAAALVMATITSGPMPRHALAPLMLPSGVVAASSSFSLGGLFGVFLKIGSVLFGSGYVLLAFLRSDLVERLGWLTEQQLLDAVAVGQVTPGPVFTTATFIGYLLGGGAGAVVATVGIFLPAFCFVALSGPLIPKIRASARAGAALDGVNVASLALMAVVTWQLGRVALVDPLTIALAGVSALLLLRTRINLAWLVLAGALVGVVAGG